MAPQWPEAKRKTLIYVFKSPWRTISRSSKKATNEITVTTRRTPSNTKNRWNFTVFPWDPHGLEAGLSAGIDGNLQLLLEGRHQLVQNPTPTFTRASTGPCYWGLKASWILSFGASFHWEASATYSKRPSKKPRPPYLWPPESQLVFQASKILLRSPAFFTCLASSETIPSATWKTATQQTSTSRSPSREVCPVSLMNPTGFTTPWAAHHRPINHSPDKRLKPAEGTGLSIWCPFFFFFKYNLEEN